MFRELVSSSLHLQAKKPPVGEQKEGPAGTPHVQVCLPYVGRSITSAHTSKTAMLSKHAHAHTLTFTNKASL